MPPLLKIIESVSNRNGHVNIIDIGGTEKYWNIVPRRFLDQFGVKITIVNLPGSSLPDNHGPFTFVHGDGRDLSMFDTNSFDVAHSNSVVEHVGDWNKMIAFSNELRRVAKKYFIQTPNYWFPIEPHCMTPFFHWYPSQVAYG
nr:methyltransferase domain-containing protein [uncultured Desulfobacter sp.]